MQKNFSSEFRAICTNLTPMKSDNFRVRSHYKKTFLPVLQVGIIIMFWVKISTYRLFHLSKITGPISEFLVNFECLKERRHHNNCFKFQLLFLILLSILIVCNIILLPYSIVAYGNDSEPIAYNPLLSPTYWEPTFRMHRRISKRRFSRLPDILVSMKNRLRREITSKTCVQKSWSKTRETLATDRPGNREFLIDLTSVFLWRACVNNLRSAVATEKSFRRQKISWRHPCTNNDCKLCEMTFASVIENTNSTKTGSVLDNCSRVDVDKRSALFILKIVRV